MTPRVDIEMAPVVDEIVMKDGSEVVSDCMPAYANTVEGDAHETVAEKGVIAKVEAMPGWAPKVLAAWVTGVIMSLIGVDEYVHQESMLAKEVITMSIIVEGASGFATMKLVIEVKYTVAPKSLE